MFSSRVVKPLEQDSIIGAVQGAHVGWSYGLKQPELTRLQPVFPLRGPVLPPLEGTVLAKQYLVYSHTSRTTFPRCQVKKLSTLNSKSLVTGGISL